MTKTILVAVSLLALSFQAQAADSPCKGLQQAPCEALAGCRWEPERIAGQTLTKAGELSKRSAKAHCRKGGKPPAKLSKPSVNS